MTYRLIAAAAGLILTGGLLTGIPLRAEVIEQVLVKVNGEIVSKSDFEQRLTSSLARPEYANAKTAFIERVVQAALAAGYPREL